MKRIETLTHDEVRRKNILTAEHQAVMEKEPQPKPPFPPAISKFSLT